MKVFTNKDNCTKGIPHDIKLDMAAKAGNHLKSSNVHPKTKAVLLAKKEQLAGVIKDVLADDTQGDMPTWKLPAPANPIGPNKPHHTPTVYKLSKELKPIAKKKTKYDKGYRTTTYKILATQYNVPKTTGIQPRHEI